MVLVLLTADAFDAEAEDRRADRVTLAGLTIVAGPSFSETVTLLVRPE